MSRPSSSRHKSLVGRRMLPSDLRPDPEQGPPRCSLSILRAETHARVSAQAQLREDAAMDRLAEDLRGLQATVEANRLRPRDGLTILRTVLAVAAIVYVCAVCCQALKPVALRVFAPEASR